MGLRHFNRISKEIDRENLEDILKGVSYFPILVDEQENDIFYRPMTKDELNYVLSTFHKYKSLDPNRWTKFFFIDLFYVIGDYLLRGFEDIRETRKMIRSYKSIFVVLIHRVDLPNTFSYFRPISLCNLLYKIIPEVIVVRIKPLLSNVIYFE
jgi:hypothetical protein